jgi:quercetin dioxygenase-like cupin family protein
MVNVALDTRLQRAVMPRAAVGVALVLTLVTGIVLGQLHSLDNPSVTAVPAASNRQAMLTARDFYDAVNTLLSFGNPSHLRGLVHPQFSDHSRHRDPGTADDLETDLLALRLAFPDLRIEPSNIVAHSGLVMTSLKVTGSPRGEIEGVAIDSDIVDAGFDYLRVEDGVVIERWASPALPWPAHAQTIDTLDNIMPRTTIRYVQLERITLERFAQRVFGGHSGTMLIIESGSIGLYRGLPNAVVNAAGVPIGGATFTTGDHITISAGSPFRIENAEPQPASVLSVTIADHPSQTNPTPAPNDDGSAPSHTRELLTNEARIRAGEGPFELVVQQVQIGPGTSIAPHDVAAAEMLLVLEGSIEAAVQIGEVALLDVWDAVSRQSGLIALSSGQALTADPGTELSYRVAGSTPATLLLITLLPAEESET